MITLRQYKPGEIIIKENTIGEAAYLIEKGRVEVTKEKKGEKAHLGYMGTGEIFGEMGMIDDKPRSATVVAVEDTTIKEIHRDEFLNLLKNDDEAAIKILKGLFNRLRETNAQILQLQAKKAERLETSEFKVAPEPASVSVQVSIEGLTPLAAKVLPQNPFPIEQLPFRIGRRSGDPLAHNDLTIPDSVPYQISRHHVTLVRDKDRVGVMDIGSTLGAEVSGKRIGGNFNPGPVFFDGSEGTLVLGTDDSPFRFKIVVHSTSK